MCENNNNVCLRNFTSDDASALCRAMHPAMTEESAAELIAKWNAGQFQGRYFEMFAIAVGTEIVGMISLYQHTTDVISIGPEVFAPYRQCGYATDAMRLACTIAKEKGYKIVSQQIRADNAASIALHRTLGFETDGALFQNAKGNCVCFYLKSLI